MNTNNSFSIANLSKEKKKVFRNIKKIQKKQVNVLSSIAFNKALLIKMIYVKNDDRKSILKPGIANELKSCIDFACVHLVSFYEMYRGNIPKEEKRNCEKAERVWGAI